MKAPFFFEGKRILLISPEGWGTSFVSKHHYATCLAERNTVFFLSTQPGPPTLEQRDRTLFLVNPPRYRAVNRLPFQVRRWLQRSQARKIKELCGGAFDIVWTFDPYFIQALSSFGDHALKIYHPVDLHHNRRLEGQCCRQADIIFSVSDLLVQRLPPGDTPRYFVNHGLAPHFLSTSPPNEDGEKRRLGVGFVGNLHKQNLDHETLYKIVLQNPEADFTFLGPHGGNLDGASRTPRESLLQPLRDRPNTEFLPAVPSSEIPDFLASMDVLLSCYLASKYPVELSNAHKLLEYLSSGRVVVSSYVDQYRNHPELIEMTLDNSELPRVVSRVLSEIHIHNSASRSSVRQAYARRNSYPAQIERIERLVQEAVPSANIQETHKVRP